MQGCSLNSQITFKRDNKVEGGTFLDFKTHYKATVIRWRDTGVKTQTNGIEVSPCMSMVNWFSTRVWRPFTERENSPFDQWCWDNEVRALAHTIHKN